MEFISSTPAIIIAVIIVLISLVLGCTAGTEEKSGAVGASVTCVTFILLVIVGNLLSIFISPLGQIHSITATEAAAEFGLESEEVYPLELGGESVGGSINMNAHSGFFTAHASASGAVGSTLKVAFENENKTYVLEIPVRKTTFVTTKKSSDETIVLNLGDHEWYGEKKLRAEGPWSLDAFFFRHDLQDKYSVDLSKKVESDGLSPIVGDNLDNALMTITEETKEAILGKTG